MFGLFSIIVVLFIVVVFVVVLIVNVVVYVLVVVVCFNVVLLDWLIRSVMTKTEGAVSMIGTRLQTLEELSRLFGSK